MTLCLHILYVDKIDIYLFLFVYCYLPELANILPASGVLVQLPSILNSGFRVAGFWVLHQIPEGPAPGWQTPSEVRVLYPWVSFKSHKFQ